jgi:hypothetical protein
VLTDLAALLDGSGAVAGAVVFPGLPARAADETDDAYAIAWLGFGESFFAAV